MSSTTMEWVPPLLFVALGVAAVAAEILWLIRRRAVSGGRSAAFVLLTDLLSLAVGFFISFVVVGVMFMLVMGPSGEGGNLSEAVMWGLLLVALLCPLVLLLLIKRVMLAVFKILSGAAAWKYSAVAAVLVTLFVTLPPAAAAYLITYSSLWK